MRKILFIGLLFLLNISVGNAQSTSWNEYKLKEHWKTTKADEIEGTYIRSRKIVNCNGFGNCRTEYFTSGEDYYILKQGDEYILSSFDDGIYGVMKKVYGSHKYFLTANLEKFTGEEGNRTYIMYLNTSNELVMESFVANQDYATATVSDTYSVIYKALKP